MQEINENKSQISPGEKDESSLREDNQTRNQATPGRPEETPLPTAEDAMKVGQVLLSSFKCRYHEKFKLSFISKRFNQSL